MKRQEHLAGVEEVAIRVRVERLKNSRYLGTNPDVPSFSSRRSKRRRAVEIAQGLALKTVGSRLEDGDPVLRVFSNKHRELST